MPLPLIPIILGGASVLAGLVGVGGAISGKEKMDQAKSRINSAKSKYEDRKGDLEREQKTSTNILDDLGKTRLEIQKNFSRFADVFEKIKNRPELREVGKEHFKFTSVDLRNIRQVSISAMDVIGGLGGAAVAGGAAAAGSWALVGLLGSASTGTALSTLAGAAATKATLAWFGGGSLAAGGLGMAGGMAVIGGLILGPAVFATGWFMDSKGDEALEQARKAESEVDSAVGKMNKIIAFSKNISRLAQALLSELKKAQWLYDMKVSQLEKLVAQCDDYNFFSEDDKILLDNNIMLVKVLMEMTRADLLKKNDNGEPIMESDAIREREVSAVINSSEQSLREIAA